MNIDHTTYTVINIPINLSEVFPPCRRYLSDGGAYEFSGFWGLYSSSVAIGRDFFAGQKWRTRLRKAHWSFRLRV